MSHFVCLDKQFRTFKKSLFVLHLALRIIRPDICHFATQSMLYVCLARLIRPFSFVNCV
jgi:hypothetical protein